MVCRIAYEASRIAANNSRIGINEQQDQSISGLMPHSGFDFSGILEHKSFEAGGIRIFNISRYIRCIYIVLLFNKLRNNDSKLVSETQQDRG